MWITNIVPHKPRLLMNLRKEAFENILGKGEKCWLISIFSNSHNVFWHSPNKFQFFSHLFFVVCNCFRFGLILHQFLSIQVTCKDFHHTNSTSFKYCFNICCLLSLPHDDILDKTKWKACANEKINVKY